MILSCGEALIDMLPRTTTLGEPAFSPYAGGAVLNTAIALGRLGAPSAFFSGISNDMLGQILTDTLEASKVDTQYCARSDRRGSSVPIGPYSGGFASSGTSLALAGAASRPRRP